MARRCELKGIANAINESFVSRNNDYRGYWSIGQLKLLALGKGLTTMVFPLILSEGNTTYNLQSYTVHRYANMLESLLIKQKIPGFWLNKAVIMIDFNINAEHAQLSEYSSSGAPFQCTCQITDDTGRDYFSIIYGRCLPHSAMRELKSTRIFPL